MAKRTIDMKLNVDTKKGTAGIKRLGKATKDYSRSAAKGAKSVSSAWDKASKSVGKIGKSTQRAAQTTAKASRTMSANMKTYTASVGNADKALKNLNKTGAKTTTMLNKMKVQASITGGGAGGAATGGIFGWLAGGATAGGITAAASGIKMVGDQVKTASGSLMGMRDLIRQNARDLKWLRKEGVHLGKEFYHINRQNQQIWVDRKAITRTKGRLKDLRKEYRAQYGWLATLRKHWIKLGIAMAAVGIGIKIAKDFAVLAAAAKQQEQAFRNLATSYGVSADKIITDLKRMSAGTVDTATLIRSAGTAMLMGLDPSKLSKLMEIARATSRVTGQTIVQAFEDISLAVGRQSRMILDNLGIIVSIGQANKNYAKELKKTVKQMTDAEKKQAFLNETLRKGQEIIKRIGVEAKTSAEYFQTLGAIWTNLKKTFGNLVLTFIKFLAKLVNAFFFSILEIETWILSLGDVIAKFVRSEAMQKYFAEMRVAMEATQQSFVNFEKQMNALGDLKPTVGLMPTTPGVGGGGEDKETWGETLKKMKDLDKMAGRQPIPLSFIEEDITAADDIRAYAQSIEDRKKKYEDFANYIHEKDDEILRMTKIKGTQVTRQYEAELIILERRYDREKELYGETMAGYAAFILGKQDLDEKYAEQRIALEKNMLGQLDYGVQKSMREAETWGETWIRVGQEVNDQLAGSFTDNMWSIIDRTKSAKQAAVDFGMSMTKWLFEIIIKQQMLNLLKQLYGTESTQASALATSGNAVEQASVVSLTVSYYALAAAKMAAGASGGGGGGFGAIVGMQHGGSVAGGQSVMVGEAGPELFTPKSSGNIISNDDLKALGGGQPEINLSMANIVDPALIDSYMASSKGKNAVLNIISGNARFIKRRLQ